MMVSHSLLTALGFVSLSFGYFGARAVIPDQPMFEFNSITYDAAADEVVFDRTIPTEDFRAIADIKVYNLDTGAIVPGCITSIIRGFSVEAPAVRGVPISVIFGGACELPFATELQVYLTIVPENTQFDTIYSHSDPFVIPG